MPESRFRTLNEFLLEFPKKEIIDTINQIDTKIGSMHAISSKDFLYFNQLLKDYYKYIKQISEGNNQLIALINQDLLLLTNQQKDIYIDQKRALEKTAFLNQDLIDKLIATLSLFDFIVVPFNNFKQNLITLKYILANLRLHLSYIEMTDKQEFFEFIKILETTIDEVHQIIENANNQIENVTVEIIELKNAYNILNSSNNPLLPGYIEFIGKMTNKLDLKEYLPDNLFVNLNKYTQICFSNLGEVITNIQYHDIIRQKMEHIQASHQELLKGLDSISIDTSKSEAIEEQLNFVVRIPEVTDIQVAQLLYTNKDYQNSIEKITTMLIDVGHEMKALNLVFNKINEGAKNINEKSLANLTNKQEIFETLSTNNNNFISDTTNKLELSVANYNELKNSFNHIFQIEKTIRTQIRYCENKISKNGKSVGSELVKRLLHLISDLQINSNSLKNNLNNITQHFLNIENIVKHLQSTRIENELHQNTIEQLQQKVTSIDTISNEFGNLTIKISEEITQSLKKIEYYGYFKATVEEIVNLLNEINIKIDYQSIKELSNGNNEILHRIEKLYTMKSERQVHAQLTNSEINGEGKNIEQSNMDDNDIELF
jgi:hypothetical protein